MQISQCFPQHRLAALLLVDEENHPTLRAAIHEVFLITNDLAENRSIGQRLPHPFIVAGTCEGQFGNDIEVGFQADAAVLIVVTELVQRGPGLALEQDSFTMQPPGNDDWPMRYAPSSVKSCTAKSVKCSRISLPIAR